MATKPSIPADVSRRVLIESGRNCAVCGGSCPLERAHITPSSLSQDNAFENLICLCANCHDRADKEKWGERTLCEYKIRPWVMRKYTDPATAQPDMSQLDVTIDFKYEDFDKRAKSHLQHVLVNLLDIPFGYVAAMGQEGERPSPRYIARCGGRTPNSRIRNEGSMARQATSPLQPARSATRYEEPRPITKK